jgi:hypothetical protein
MDERSFPKPLMVEYSRGMVEYGQEEIVVYRFLLYKT